MHKLKTLIRICWIYMHFPMKVYYKNLQAIEWQPRCIYSWKYQLTVTMNMMTKPVDAFIDIFIQPELSGTDVPDRNTFNSQNPKRLYRPAIEFCSLDNAINILSSSVCCCMQGAWWRPAVWAVETSLWTITTRYVLPWRAKGEEDPLSLSLLLTCFLSFYILFFKCVYLWYSAR